jgi:peptide/nickel transport system permease protein
MTVFTPDIGPEGGFVLTRRQIFWIRFCRHRAALVSLWFTGILYVVAIFAEFMAPYGPFERRTQPAGPAHRGALCRCFGRLSPAPVCLQDFRHARHPHLSAHLCRGYGPRYLLRLFVRGHSYDLLGIFPTDLHLFGVAEGGHLFLAGTDALGRDVFSRMLFGARTSLFVGLIGLAIGFTLGLFFGGISGYYGGSVDNLVQRLIEFLQSLPTLPLWMALAALVPATWSPVQVYLGISTVLAVLGWTTLARVVRGKLLSLREEDYVMAARINGVSEARIITTHLLPGLTSYLVVYLTLAVPQMILGDVAPSFMGDGLCDAVDPYRC